MRNIHLHKEEKGLRKGKEKKNRTHEMLLVNETLGETAVFTITDSLRAERIMRRVLISVIQMTPWNILFLASGRSILQNISCYQTLVVGVRLRPSVTLVRDHFSKCVTYTHTHAHTKALLALENLLA